MSKAAELAALIANVNKGSSLANKNFIINGNMSCWQRATAATAQGNGQYNTVDRWKGWVNGGGAYTTEQSTGHLATTGHENALKFSVTTADTSIAAGDYYSFVQFIEGQNLQSLQYGTSDAKPITLSFWVKATKTGTNTVSITKDDSTAYRMIKEYTISSSNTWEYKTITIEPDSNIKAGGGAIANDTGRGFQITWILKYGSNYEGTADTWTTSGHYTTTNQVNHMDSTSNTFYITGVQLEIGEKATEFEHEPYETTLAKCQRYYIKYQAGSAYSYLGSGQVSASTTARIVFQFPTEMNHVPVLEQSANNTLNVYATDSEAFSADATINNPSNHSSAITCTVSSGLTAKAGASITANNSTSAFLAFESEL